MNNAVVLGKGSYGLVFRITTATGNTKAVKCITAESYDDVAVFEKEVDVLNSLANKSKFICELAGTFEKMPRYFIVMPCYRRTLHSLIRSKLIDAPTRKRFIHQIAQGLLCCKQNTIIHRDLASKNILIDEQNNVRICDFGMAIRYKGRAMNVVVCTLPYRAVELLLGECHYDYGVDVWSLGSLALEMTLHDYFINRNNETDQLREIVEKIGFPPAPGQKSESNLQSTEWLPESEMRLYREMLCVCPKQRISIEQIVLQLDNQ